MLFIVKKKVHGKTYAYEYTTIWDKVNKKYKKILNILEKLTNKPGRLPGKFPLPTQQARISEIKRCGGGSKNYLAEE